MVEVRSGHPAPLPQSTFEPHAETPRPAHRLPPSSTLLTSYPAPLFSFSPPRRRS